ncbi:hypothetical protein C7E18_22605, partial [Stenotrophomonas maltophilia]
MSRLFRSVEGGELFPNGSVVCIDGLPPARPARALIAARGGYTSGLHQLKRRPRSGRNESSMSRLFRSVEGGELFPNGSVVCI